MTYDQAVQYLFTLGRELASPQHARAAKFDLSNITKLSEHLGHPERAFASVHVAGTNGKGSTAAMLASILRAAGLRTGLYTSPHLVRINERMRIDGAEISDAAFAETFTRVHVVIERLLASGVLAAHPTFFECVTAMAFDFFAREKVELAVIEVGLGGRLDSTNIILPKVAVITQVDFDHENFLGHSIEQIAAEKAGIIKPQAWVVSAAGNRIARDVVVNRAAEQRARLVEIDAAYRLSDVRQAGGCYRFALAKQGSEAPPLVIRLPLAGRFQIRNAVTAIAAAQLLAESGYQIGESAIVAGLEAVRWPGRLERVQQHPDVYFDGAHNPAGAREVLGFWNEHLAGRRIHLIYAAMRDKAVDEVAGLLFPRAATVTLTQSPQPRAISADVLASMTSHLAQVVDVIPNPASALKHALSIAADDDVVFAAGSLFLVGDLHQYWDHRADLA